MVLIVLVIDGLLWLLANRIQTGGGRFELKPSDYVTIPGFIVTLMQISRALVVQKASFVHNYISKFFTDADLLRTFHALILNYRDEDWLAVKAEAAKLTGIAGDEDPDKLTRKKEQQTAEQLQNEQKLRESQGFSLETLEAANRGRVPGARRYHPDYFQGSEEEKSLDALLGYFDTIGFHYHRRLVLMRDVAGALSFHLSVLAARDVVQHYLKGSGPRWWKGTQFYRQTGALAPYSYLALLLADFARYNAASERHIRAMHDTVQESYR